MSMQSKCELLTVQQVAELLQVPVSWVYGRMRKRSLERLPAYRLGKYWRFGKRGSIDVGRAPPSESRGRLTCALH